jgi:hypothetical protein
LSLKRDASCPCAVDHERQRRDEADLAGHQWGRGAGPGGEGPGAEEGPKQTKSFGLSGLLAAETRMFQVRAGQPTWAVARGGGGARL